MNKIQCIKPIKFAQVSYFLHFLWLLCWVKNNQLLFILIHLSQWNFPFLSIGSDHFHLKGCCVLSFIFIQISIEHSVSKWWRPWSDTTCCSVWSGSASFAYVPQKGGQVYIGSVYFFVFQWLAWHSRFFTQKRLSLISYCCQTLYSIGYF